MKLTKKQKEFIINAASHVDVCEGWRKDIKKEFPKLFKKCNFKVGDWVCFKCFLTNQRYARILKPTTNTPYTCFNVDIPYNSEGGLNVQKEETRKATKEEIEKHLIEEAKRRCLWKNKNVKCLYINGLNKAISLNPYYDDEQDQLWVKYGLVYEKGKWAEKLETITKEEAEKQLGKTII